MVTVVTVSSKKKHKIWGLEHPSKKKQSYKGIKWDIISGIKIISKFKHAE